MERWLRIWTWLNAIWLGITASPMLIILLFWDTHGLLVYLGMWMSFILFPTVIVYVVGVLVGLLLGSARR